jgi:hypothetical protein
MPYAAAEQALGLGGWSPSPNAGNAMRIPLSLSKKEKERRKW